MTNNSHDKTEALFEFANRYMVAGVSAAARMNAATGRPLYLTHGDGCRLYDVDGRVFIDYNLSHGATFLGYNHPQVQGGRAASRSRWASLRSTRPSTTASWRR